MPPAAPAVAVRDVAHRFRGPPVVEALARISLEIPRGSFVSLIGPSGCGKSTLLRIVAGLLAPSSGTVLVNGEDAIGRPGAVAYMPQRDLLMPWLRARDNAALGAELSGVPRAEARARALELFERFGLGGFERSWPAQLSGGMRQRLALLRTFLMPHDTLLLDEPFGALDAITRREMQGWLQDVLAREPRTVVLVTHDVEEALMLSDTVHVFSPRPGRVIESLSVPLERPRRAVTATADEFVALKARLLEVLGA